MKNDTLNIHDDYKFDIQLDYNLDENEKNTVSEIEAYLFIPNSMGINKHNYSKEDFYSDMHSFVKLNIKPYDINELLNNKQSPLFRLEDSITALKNESNDDGIKSFEYHLKSFCHIVDKTMKSSDQKTVSQIKDLLHIFRNLFTDFKKYSFNPKIKEIFELGDEFLSLAFEDYLYQIPNMNSDSLVLEALNQEYEYREELDYGLIPEENSDNEELLFRRKAINTFINSMSFISTRIFQEGVYTKQITFALGASIAMIFSTIVGFYAASNFNSNSAEITLIFIISYMFKDRIKELSRNFLWGKVKHHFSDHKIAIFYNEIKLGWCRESFFFMKKNQISDEIVQLRNRDRLTEIDSEWVGEQIIMYKKQVNLLHKNLKNLHQEYQIESIHDVIRLNIFKYLKNISHINKTVYSLHNNIVAENLGAYVYYVDIIIKHKVGETIRYNCFRATINRDGIKKITRIYNQAT